MNDVTAALKQPRFRWLSRHLNHIAENIVFKKRNVSFLAINALFRSKDYIIQKDKPPFKKSYSIRGFVPIQKNDKLRLKAEELEVVFILDKYRNIVVITAHSESDEITKKIQE